MKEMIEQLQEGVVKRSLQALYEYLDCDYWSDCDDYFYFDNDEDLAFIIKRTCVKINYEAEQGAVVKAIIKGFF